MKVALRWGRGYLLLGDWATGVLLCLGRILAVGGVKQARLVQVVSYGVYLQVGTRVSAHSLPTQGKTNRVAARQRSLWINCPTSPKNADTSDIP